MSELFSQLPDFLKEHIHENRWDSFRRIQEETFRIVMTTDSDVIVTSETSGGKTEAAFIPALTSVYEDRPKGICILYVSPLKALINDQFGRLSTMLRRSEIPVTGWHGDVGSNVKDRMKDSPEGILQITPESLQALVSGDHDVVESMFPQLMFVIIDEMHAFMDSDRGLQLLCCLDRLERISGCSPRRIGLSATISDLDTAKEWIRAGRYTDVRTVIGKDRIDKNVAISVYRFPRSDAVEGSIPRKESISSYYRALYKVTDRNRCLLFTNSRETAEITARSLRAMNDHLNDDRKVLLHHGRLSHEMRRSTEEALNSPIGKVTVVSTSTLEMGMDVGEMDRIVQIDSPHGCSSLSQRMGRSGRRGGSQTLAILCREDEDRHLPEEVLGMNLIKSIAEVQLSVDEGWCEPPHMTVMPYGLLFHQTLEYMKESTGVMWKDLERDILSQYPFRNISRDDYRELLRHMIDGRILHIMDDDTLLIGQEGERIVFGKDFHTVFRSLSEVEVRYNGERIGSLEGMPEQGDVVRIDGGLWIIRSVDIGGRYAEAEPADEGSVTGGRGLIPEVHPTVMRRMRKIIGSDDVDVRLTPSASKSLVSFREEYGRAVTSAFVEVNGLLRIHPWNGTRGFRTLKVMLDNMEDVKVVRSYEPYMIDVRTVLSPEQIRKGLERMLSLGPSKVIGHQIPDIRFGKFDRFVPENLLLKAYIYDHLDWNKRILPV